jgi:CubicO group peptidase (beta-lactamase class C family)
MVLESSARSNSLSIVAGIGMLAAALSSTLFAQSDVPMAKPESVGMSTDRLQRVHKFMQEYIDTNQIAGSVTLIARKGKVVYYDAQGWRYKEENAPMPKDAIFSLMSMTKPIVSTALMMLWEDGKFMLDDPISKWLPSYAKMTVTDVSGSVPAVRPVTVRNILTHTSGLSLEPGPRPPTLLEEIEKSSRRPLAFQPGERWQYGASTDFVAALVERISGMTIDEFVRQRIFEPLGIRDTYYNIPKEKVDRVAAVYRPDQDGKIVLSRKPEYHEPTAYFPGVAGLNGTAADYFRFSQMILNGGEYDGHRLLGRMTVDMMITNQIGGGPNKKVYIRGDGYGFGLGFAVLTDPSKAPDALSMGTFTWGGADGTLFWIDPVEQLIGIMMIQISPYNHFNIRPLFSVVVSQAITDSLAVQRPNVMGYDTPR